MTRAYVVGSGPNGLAAAVTLALEGVEVIVLEAADKAGGGVRSSEATLAGLVHDDCAGFHPFAVDSVFTRSVDLSAHGLEWAWPTVQYAHPLDGGRGAHVVRSLADTASGLGVDASAYRRLYGGLAEHFAHAADEFLRPVAHLPRHPLDLARMGPTAPLPAGTVARRLRTDEARGLWAGVCAHGFRPLEQPTTAAVGMALGAAAHHAGWPVAVGGSQALADALIGQLIALGGRVETGVHVTSLGQLERSDAILLDTAPRAAADLLGDLLPRRVRRAYQRFSHGPAAFQLAMAVEGGLPWSYEPARRAGVVHLGGTLEEIAVSERATVRGRMPERPFVLLGQQYLADSSRSRDGVHPVDCYAHVPNGWDGDATEAVLAQIERFAPGARDRIVSLTARPPAEIAAHNPNFVGGDIATGAKTPRQLLLGPRRSPDPYRTGVPGIYLCSAATPPGPGAHGLCGHHAARSALRHLRSSP